MEKTCLKWLGGKSLIIDNIMSKFPKVINDYHEIFVGGGSVLLALLECIRDGRITITGKIYAYDLNENLIYLYKNILSDYDSLYKEICSITGNSITSKSAVYKCSKEVYYDIRQLYNELSDDEKKSVKGSALFMILNKTCFRGMYRIGPNGFNVPFGNYKNPKIADYKNIKKISELIQDVEFKCCDFRVSLTNIFETIKTIETSANFIYLDPPYYPIKENSFVKYTKDGFDADCHKTLFDLIHKHKLDVNILLSNADVKYVRDNFVDYNITSIVVKRRINALNPKQTTNELIIHNNYETLN